MPMKYLVRRLVLCPIAAASGVLTAVVHAQDPVNDSISRRVYDIPEVTVKARRTPPSVKAASPLQVMNKAEMERMGISEVADAVRHFSGVSVKDYGGIGGLKTISVRSLGAQHTGVIYDGVSVSDCQSGQIDISRFSLTNISQLTLTIGQSDDIYQSARAFASAGVLHIQTDRPDFSEQNWHINTTLKAGSFGLANPSVLYSQQLSQRTSFPSMVTTCGQTEIILSNYGTVIS